MKNIDVYIYNNKVYRLDQNHFISDLPDLDKDELYKYFIKFKEEYNYNINLAIIGFNHEVRNALYSVYPDIIIIIHPSNVIRMVDKYLENDQCFKSAQEELAASLEIGYYNIYTFNSRLEAASYYKEWQEYVPLGIQKLNDLILTIDYYYEEIFNYFDFRDIINKKIL
ncbi:MAG: transposase [Epulopiscium sp.]|nr:transposase [Candidatus Epulonipiscium sp.]